MINKHILSYLIVCFLFVILISYSNYLIASDTKSVNGEISSSSNVEESESDIYNQLNDYKSVSNWIYNNQDKFKEIIEKTAKTSKTKWIVDDSLNNLNQLNGPNNIVSNVQPNSNVLDENIYHVVKKGETLYSLSKMYNIKIEDILRKNNLNINNPIKENQKLLISLKQDNNNSLNNKNNNQNQPEDSSPYKVIIPNEESGKNVTASIKNNESKMDWPIIGRLLVNFGPQKNGLVSEGINIMAKAGSNVKTIASGVVIYVGSDIKALGNIILIKHKDGWISVYGYLGDTYVKKGEELKRGTVIATVAKLSNLKVSQLHFELRKNITPKDPLEYLNSYT